jgi:outer membrane protein insertion porin family
MGKLSLICCAMCVLSPLGSPGVFARYTSSENYDYKTIESIDITMENLPSGGSFDPNIVLSKLKTHVGDPFSQLTFDSDLKTLANEYDRVEPSVSVKDGKVYISLKLWARPTIRSITWNGNEKFKTKKLQKELGIKALSPYNRQEFNKAFNKLKEFYIKRGYFEAELRYTTRLDTKTNEVEITIDIDEGRSGKIEGIALEGFTAQESSELLATLLTKRYNFVTSWLTGTGIINEEALDQDNLMIVNFLQDRGYADAKVDIYIEEGKDKSKIIIKIVADRGPIFHFGDVTFTGNTLFSDPVIESRFLVHPGEIYSPEKLRKTAQNIKDLYGRLGYIDADVQYETHLVENEPIYNVDYIIDEGEQYKIGLIHVVGNVHTQTHVILRESLLVPGETFDSAKLKATQTRLENIGYFKNVNVYAVRAQEDHLLGDNYRDVYIEVEETTTGSLNLFFGFSTQDDLFGGLELSENNFNYAGFSKLFTKGPVALRGGGEFASARVNIGQKQKSVTLSWITPYFRDTLWRVGFDINGTTSTIVSSDYDIKTIGGSIFASYPLNMFWTFGTKYRARYADIDVSHNVSREEQKLDQQGNISALAISMNFDSTDSALMPHNGFRSMLEAEFAGLLGNFTFMRFGYTNSYYSQLWQYGIMKYRFDFKYILPLGQTSTAEKIPLSERFFLGGENSVRGVRPFDIGPHYSNGDPTGGISSTLFSIEYLQHVYGPVDLFVFTDAGSISLDQFALGRFTLTYGIGTRLSIGNRLPIVLGYGIPVNLAKHEAAKKFFFSMGGQF